MEKSRTARRNDSFQRVKEGRISATQMLQTSRQALCKSEAGDDRAGRQKHYRLPIAGSNQAHIALIAYDPDKEEILYASESCSRILDIPHSAFLCTRLKSHFGASFVHGLRNLAGMPHFSGSPLILGEFEVEGRALNATAFRSGDVCVIELEHSPMANAKLSEGQALDAIIFLTRVIEKCDNAPQLLQKVGSFLRYLSGFDRVTICKALSENSLLISSEFKGALLPPMLGKAIPLPALEASPFVYDIEQGNSSIYAARENAPSLDLSFAASRAIGETDLKIAENFEARATMLMPIKINDKPWGVLGFHSKEPKMAAPWLRQVLACMMPVFSLKLGALLDKPD